jgi:tryptophan synthase beta subunit
LGQSHLDHVAILQGRGLAEAEQLASQEGMMPALGTSRAVAHFLDKVHPQSTTGGRWECITSVKKLATNIIKKLSIHRGKDEISQGVEAH